MERDRNVRRGTGPSFRRCVLAAAGFLAIAVVVAGCMEATAPPLVSGGGSVEVQVTRGGKGGTLVFVPVHINGHGPYAFALDTGASHSVVDRDIAHRLGLPRDGRDVEMSGVAAEAVAEPVKVADWRVGNVKLPTDMIVAIELTGPMRDGGLQGLLGSDVLSRFGTISLDYARSVLVLNPAVEEPTEQPAAEGSPEKMPAAEQPETKESTDEGPADAA